jgi:hypothetical protein
VQVNTGLEIYTDDVEVAIADACAEFGIDDLRKEGQRLWKAVMRYVGKHIFPDTAVLKDKTTVMLQGNSIPTDSNRYDYNILNILCDYYIGLSDRYNKLVSNVAYAYFCNIAVETVDKWALVDDSSMVSSKTALQIYKKLQGTRLDCIKDKTFDNGNVTGSIAVGNWEYSLNMPGVSRDAPRPALRSSELPKLATELHQNGTQLADAQAQKPLEIVSDG